MRKADNLPPSCVVVTKSGLSRPLMGLIYLYLRSVVVVVVLSRTKISVFITVICGTMVHKL